MKPTECYEILGLKQGASISEVRRAYTDFAWKLHPDHAVDDSDSHERFSQITAAYTILRNVAPRDAAFELEVVHCASCGDVGEVLKGLDGRACCPPCLLAQRRKQLPMQPMRIVRCLVPIALQLIALMFLLRAAQNGDNKSALVSVAALILSMGWLTRDVLRSIISAR